MVRPAIGWLQSGYEWVMLAMADNDSGDSGGCLCWPDSAGDNAGGELGDG